MGHLRLQELTSDRYAGLGHNNIVHHAIGKLLEISTHFGYLVRETNLVYKRIKNP